MSTTPLPSDWADDASGNRCLQYLMGELSHSDAEAFETELAQSPALADELVRQSELICCLSESMPVTAAKSVSKSAMGYRVVKVFAAVAACLMLAFVARSWKGEAESSQAEEDLLIAQAWVDASESFQSLDLDVENDTDWDQESTIDDGSLSWVMAAVEAEESIDG